MKLKFTSILLLCAAVSFAQVPNYAPTNGLVGWWSFNGNATDQSGNGNNLLNNFVTYSTDAQRGQVAQFNGSSWLEKGSALFTSLTPISISFWVKTTSNSALDIIGQACGNDCSDDIRVQLNAAQCNQTGLSFKSPAHFANAPAAIPDGNWHHCVLVMGESNNFSYSNFKFFVDGVFISIGPTQCGHNWGGWTYNPNSTYNFTIGKGGPLGVYFQGLLDNVGIWTVPLTTCDIKKLYNEQLGSIQTQSTCSSFEWNGNTYEQSGTYTYQSIDLQGCDSIATLNLTINSNTYSSESQSAIDSYTWPVNGQTYTQSGVYTDTLVNAAGCDSVITLNLELDFTGIQTHSNSSLQLYPNPNNGDFTIENQSNQKIDGIELADLSGNVIYKSTDIQDKYSFDNLSSGLYIVTIYTEGGAQKLRFVKR